MKSAIQILTLTVLLFCQISSCKQRVGDSENIKQVETNLVPNIHPEGDQPGTIQGRMAYFHIKGLSIAVIQDYKIIWAKGYGWADDSLKMPVTAQTLFQAGSISKSLNSMGILKLAQDKKIDLYTDINTYLQSWKFPYDSLSKGKKITIANLLSHTAGLSVHGFYGYEKGMAIPTLPQVLDGAKPANSPPVRSMYAPGVKYEYSGGGTTILQLILMDVTHERYDKYMYDNVLQPLGMTSSTYLQPPVNKTPESLSTAYYPSGKKVPGRYHIYPEQAAAGLWTNPTDLSKYIIETQLALEGKSAKVLNQEMTKLRLTPYIDKSAALGVFIDSLNGIKYFEHGGVDEGFESQYYGSLEGGNGVVIMTNTAGGSSIIPEIVNSIAKVYGFKGLYSSKTIKLAAVADSVLQKYAGQYKLDPETVITVTKEGGRLYMQFTSSPKDEVFAESQSLFFSKVFRPEYEFIKDDKGEVTKLVIMVKGVKRGEAKKIK